MLLHYINSAIYKKLVVMLVVVAVVAVVVVNVIIDHSLGWRLAMFFLEKILYYIAIPCQVRGSEWGAPRGPPMGLCVPLGRICFIR
jgi:hypothetical protein